jgi:hypothetical protein
MWQRLCLREENLGFFTLPGFVEKLVPSFTRFAVVAKLLLLNFFLLNSYFFLVMP